jgi:hypothetical protein
VTLARFLATAALTNLGNLVLATHAEAGAAEKAMALYRDALKVDPKDARANFNLACLEHRNFNLAGLARRAVATAAASAVGAAAAEADPGMAMDLVAARYQSVLAVWPQCRPAHLHLGLLYQEGSLGGQARVHYRAVLSFSSEAGGLHRHADWPPPRYITEENAGVQAVAREAQKAPHWLASLAKAEQTTLNRLKVDKEQVAAVAGEEAAGRWACPLGVGVGGPWGFAGDFAPTPLPAVRAPGSARRGGGRTSRFGDEPPSPLSPFSPGAPLSPFSPLGVALQVTKVAGKQRRRSSVAKLASLKASLKAASASATAFAEAPYADVRAQLAATRSDGASALRIVLDAHTKASEKPHCNRCPFCLATL